MIQLLSRKFSRLISLHGWVWPGKQVVEGRGWSKTLLLWLPLPCRDPCVMTMWKGARGRPEWFSCIPLLLGLLSVVKTGHTSWVWQSGSKTEKDCGCWKVAFLNQTWGKAQGAMHQSKTVFIPAYAPRMCAPMCQHRRCEHTCKEEGHTQESHPPSVLYFYLIFISYWRIVDSVVFQVYSSD